MGFEQKSTLFFLVAGRTKNKFDGSFGLVKRKLKQINALTPWEMEAVVAYSSEPNRATFATNVKWIDLKSFFNKYFTIPASFKMNKYHVFKFSAEFLA